MKTSATYPQPQVASQHLDGTWTRRPTQSLAHYHASVVWWAPAGNNTPCRVPGANPGPSAWQACDLPLCVNNIKQFCAYSPLILTSCYEMQFIIQLWSWAIDTDCCLQVSVVLDVLQSLFLTDMSRGAFQKHIWALKSKGVDILNFVFLIFCLQVLQWQIYQCLAQQDQPVFQTNVQIPTIMIFQIQLITSFYSKCVA